MRSTVAGSRPAAVIAASTFSRASSISAQRFAVAHAFQMSPYLASRPSMRGAVEPIMIGGPLGTRAARAQFAVAGGVVRAVEVDPPVAEQAVDDGDRLLEAADAVVVGVAEGDVVGLVPAGAEAEDEATAGDFVDGVGDLGQQRRVAVTGAGDEGTDLDARGDGGERGDVRPALPRPLRLQALGRDR